MTINFNERYPTLAIFEGHARGILNIIKAADIYALHIIAIYRNTKPDSKTIDKILKSDALSLLTCIGSLYHDHEVTELEKTGQMRNIGQQIIVATYTALEVYLIEKFKEYYRYLLRNKDEDFIENSLRRFASCRNFEEIKTRYSELLKIHLSAFEITCYTTEKCDWRPQSTWDAILLIEKARNQIAHTGKSTYYKITTLVDAWYPFEFVCEWVRTFDVEFDHMVYRGKESAIIKEYKTRLVKQRVKKSSARLL